MVQHSKKTISDWTVIFLGSIGLFLGVSGLLFPESQYAMLGIHAISVGPVIPGLLGSAGLSASYMGLLYIFGTLKKWPHFKHYLIFARMVMAIGFVALVVTGRASQSYLPAAVWEAAGAMLIATSLGWDAYKTANNTPKI